MYVTSMEQLTRKIKEYHGLTTHHIISEINKKFPNGNTYMRDLKEASIHSFNMGKGFRPAFLFLFNELFSEITDKTVSLAAAIETLHNSSLIHDDWMDKDEMRRGVITVWKKFLGELHILWWIRLITQLVSQQHILKIRIML